MENKATNHLIVFILGILFSSSITVAGDKTFLYYGTVHKKLSNGKMGPPVADKDVLFTNKRADINVRVRTRCNGFYQAKLPWDDYTITAVQSGYKVVIRDQSRFLTKAYQDAKREKQANYERRLKNEHMLEDKASQPQAENNYIEPIDSAPIVTISCSRDTVVVGEDFTLTLSARDVDGLKELWWYATYSKSRELSQKHIFDCSAKTSTQYSWTVKAQQPGRLIIAADATDVKYDPLVKEVANQASLVRPLQEVQLLVLDKKPSRGQD